MYQFELSKIESGYDENDSIYYLRLEILSYDDIGKSYIEKATERISKFKERLNRFLEVPVSPEKAHNKINQGYGFTHHLVINLLDKEGCDDMQKMKHQIDIYKKTKEGLADNEHTSIEMKFGFSRESDLKNTLTLKTIERFSRKYLNLDLLRFEGYHRHKEENYPKPFNFRACYKQIEDIFKNTDLLAPKEKTNQKLEEKIVQLFKESQN